MTCPYDGWALGRYWRRSLRRHFMLGGLWLAVVDGWDKQGRYQ